jgi:alginate O-acetyltransferase complex protein AlgI
LHGLYLAAHRRFRHRSPKSDMDPPTWRDVPAIVATFHLVALSWVFFRADSFTQAWDVLVGILGFRAADGIPFAGLALLVPAALAVLFIDLVQRRTGRHEGLMTIPAFARGVVYGAFFMAIVLFSGQEVVPFLYFQF